MALLRLCGPPLLTLRCAPICGPAYGLRQSSAAGPGQWRSGKPLALSVLGRCGLKMLSCEAVGVVLTSVSPARWSRS